VTRATIVKWAAFLGGALALVAFARAKGGWETASLRVADEDRARVRPEPSPSAAYPFESAVTIQEATVADDRTAESNPGGRDDASQMARLREVQDADPTLAYELAKEGQRRFPESANAAERAAIAVKALALQGKRSEARREAGDMVAKYPDSPWARDVEMHTGAHPRRSQTSP
jgi:hypothetical protein